VLENLAHNLREYLKERSPTYVRDAISRATEYSRSGGAYSLLTSKYAGGSSSAGSWSSGSTD
jgi:hypothetical protein